MQFDHLDNKFKEAAAHHHPPYDEQAWTKMEKLLDKHMPVEEKKRRFFYILFFAGLLVLSGLLVTQPWKQNKPVQPSKKDATSLVTAKTITTGQTPATNNVNAGNHERTVEITSPVPTATNIPPVYATNDLFRVGKHINKKQPLLTSAHNTNIVPGVNEPSVNEAVKANQTDNKPKDPLIINQHPGKDAIGKTSPNQLLTTPSSVTKETTPAVSSVQKHKEKSRKTHVFFISLGAGPDISFVRAKDPGTFKIFGGGGLGYTYNNRLTLRAGFYSARKIYTAQPQDYNAPPIFYTYYPNLQKVEANCKVYEVPVAVSYHFGKGAKRNFFASAGLSSYFMKEETYNYYYKVTPTSPTQSRTRSIYEGSNHFFAGMTLSAGYTKNINKRVSLTVEPYTKLPLSGIGYGKVKLNSAGVLFSAGIKPFQKRK